MKMAASRTRKRPAESGRKLISVIICTRDRAGLLGKAIESVLSQDFPQDDYELVVVDNGSRDGTPDIVRQAQRRFANVRYQHEADVGLCIARNTGWRAATGKYIAYLDDDAVALPGWLGAIESGFAEAGDTAGVIGGRAHPIWESPRPNWLADEIAYSLTIVDWGSTNKVIEDLSREWLVGANMAMPRLLLSEIGGFHPWLDRVGDALLSNGDTFLQRQAVKRGYQCLYRPTMAVDHLVPKSRLTQKWFLTRYYWQGMSDAVSYIIDNTPTPAERAKIAIDRRSVVRIPYDSPSLQSHLDRESLSTACFAVCHAGFIAGMLGAVGR